MKSIIATVLLTPVLFFTLSGETNTQPVIRIDDYVKLPGAEGFLRYSGEHAGVMVCAVSSDIGSAVPSEDFRLYAKYGDSYRLLLSLPILTQRGYRCIARGETLSVYVTRIYSEIKHIDSANPMVTIDLEKIIQARTDPLHPSTPTLPRNSASSPDNLGAIAFFNKKYKRNGRYIPKWGPYLGADETEYENGFNAGLTYSIEAFANMGSDFEVKVMLKNNLKQSKEYQMGFWAALEVYSAYEATTRKP